MNLSECIEKGFLRRIGPDKRLIEKELAESGNDERKAKASLGGGDFKWTIIAAYYSMFHSAKALLISMGYMEKRHFVIGVFLEELAKNGRMEMVYADYFASAMEAREGADYSYKYSRGIAEEIAGYMEKFNRKMKGVLK